MAAYTHRKLGNLVSRASLWKSNGMLPQPFLAIGKLLLPVQITQLPTKFRCLEDLSCHMLEKSMLIRKPVLFLAPIIGIVKHLGQLRASSTCPRDLFRRPCCSQVCNWIHSTLIPAKNVLSTCQHNIVVLVSSYMVEVKWWVGSWMSSEISSSVCILLLQASPSYYWNLLPNCGLDFHHNRTMMH